jgi:hypothetical protein
MLVKLKFLNPDITVTNGEVWVFGDLVDHGDLLVKMVRALTESGTLHTAIQDQSEFARQIDAAFVEAFEWKEDDEPLD